MSEFDIVQGAPYDYKDQILSFWEAYLPGTPPERFEWLNTGNPAGPAIWMLAFDKSSKRLSGVCTIMPRHISYFSKMIKTGILGDFMVHHDYRNRGLGFQIIMEVARSYRDMGFGLLYVVPNDNASKVVLKAGFRKIGSFHRLTRPIKTRYFLEKYLGCWSTSAAPLLDTLIMPSSKESRACSRTCVEEVTMFDSGFDDLWGQVRRSNGDIWGERSSAYLEWRYSHNPCQWKFRMITIRDKTARQLTGYLVFAEMDKRFEIYDLVTLRVSHTKELLKALLAIALRAGCDSVNIYIHKSNPLYRNLKSQLFFYARDQLDVYFLNNESSTFVNLHFFSGDRNI